MRLLDFSALGLFTAFILVGQGTSMAQELSPEKARERLSATEGDLKSKRDRAKTLEMDVVRLKKERERINSRLLETAARIQESEARMTSIEGRLSGLEAQEQLVRGSLEQRHEQILSLLGSLQRMGRNPPPVMITQRKDALSMVRSAMLLASAFPGLKSQALELTSRLDELVRVMSDIRNEGEQLRAESKRLNEAQTRLAGLMSEKKKSLSERQGELAEVRLAAVEISKKVSGLNELIARLDQKVKEKTALGRHNAELENTPSTPSSVVPNGQKTGGVGGSPAPGGVLSPEGNVPAGGTGSPGSAGPQVAILAPSSSSFSNASPGRLTPAIPFRESKGKLLLPTSGKQVLSYGDKTKYGASSKGIVLQTRPSAQITSPCDGWVVYAGEFRSYGQLLIINAGGGYHILLAGLSQIDVRPGDFVLAGSPVGTMRHSLAPGKRTAPQKGPVLYVEFRKNGRPFNPDPWWVSGSRKVQG